ncbi:uncharacterized protein N7487_006840 [Penicillium crustosum]|uniref:uncharacterized protein n=1 Tax=Penicillium crustosum TaxID=36656 RepID=UPI002384FF21|nr:uncharacterized protein N7487_006840 [Penicillium crustosum]KAJ5412481.1 hypothetical protein N7487_006840 [Penicillium crustosum]
MADVQHLRHPILCPPTRGPGGSIVLIHITNHTSLVQIVCSVAEKGKGLRKEAEADGYGGEGPSPLLPLPGARPSRPECHQQCW